ncbi:LLM class flavin-dependent oxidoreductase [Lentzea sp. HUAS TT2]|uniref:LLM class flavin-dependent oxidoreductase n=1 Tax=Lentzea sp. HUAS TT2 TaxID=3447454 RepID=UPI003F711DE6
MGLRLSVLDTSPVVQGSTPREALHDTADLAELAEEPGFHRYWVPEHHGMRSRREGNRILLPGPDDAHRLPDDGRVLAGGPETITRKLQAVLDETGTSELMITSPFHHHADRRRGYELIAAISGSLTPAGAAEQ